MLYSGADHGASGGARRSGSDTVPPGAPRGGQAGTRKAGAPRVSGALGVQQAGTMRASTGPTPPASPRASVAIRALEERATAAPDPRSPRSPSLRSRPGPARRGRGRRAGLQSHLHNGGWSQQRRIGAQAAETRASTARRATERPRAARGRPRELSNGRARRPRLLTRARPQRAPLLVCGSFPCVPSWRARFPRVHSGSAGHTSRVSPRPFAGSSCSQISLLSCVLLKSPPSLKSSSFARWRQS